MWFMRACGWKAYFACLGFVQLCTFLGPVNAGEVVSYTYPGPCLGSLGKILTPAVPGYEQVLAESLGNQRQDIEALWDHRCSPEVVPRVLRALGGEIITSHAGGSHSKVRLELGRFLRRVLSGRAVDCARTPSSALEKKGKKAWLSLVTYVGTQGVPTECNWLYVRRHKGTKAEGSRYRKQLDNLRLRLESWGVSPRLWEAKSVP